MGDSFNSILPSLSGMHGPHGYSETDYRLASRLPGCKDSPVLSSPLHFVLLVIHKTKQSQDDMKLSDVKLEVKAAGILTCSDGRADT